MRVLLQKKDKFIMVFLWMVMTVFLTSCSSSVTRQSADWSYAKDAISVNIKAQDSLNVYDGYSHALSMAIIQVSSPDKLNQLLQTKNGLVSVIDNKNPASEQSAFKRIVLQPGQQKSLLLDREHGTQYVFLIFGYASEIVNKGYYQIPIPLDDSPQKLNISVVLGPTYVSSIKYTK